jgi:glucose-1-phosphatase
MLLETASIFLFSLEKDCFPAGSRSALPPRAITIGFIKSNAIIKFNLNISDMATIKLIIFDVGGVIDNFDESQYIRYITKKLGIDGREFAYTLIPLLDKMEIGKMDISQAKNILAKKFKVSVGKLEWDSAFIKLNTLNEDVINLINKLSKNYKIVILTNVSKSRHIVKMERYLHRVKYDAIFTSCYLKMHKPQHRIYRFVIKKMKVNPKEAIFVDNIEKNVAGAREVGIHGIRFTDYRSLVIKLKKLDVSW